MQKFEAPVVQGKEKNVPEITDEVLKDVFPKLAVEKLSPDQREFMKIAKEKLSPLDQELVDKIKETSFGYVDLPADNSSKDEILNKLTKWRDTVLDRTIFLKKGEKAKVLEQIDDVLLNKAIKLTKGKMQFPKRIALIIEIASENRKNNLPQFKSSSEVNGLLRKISNSELYSSERHITRVIDYVQSGREFYKQEISEDQELKDLQYLLNLEVPRMKIKCLKTKFRENESKIEDIRLKIINKIVKRAEALKGLNGWVKDIINNKNKIADRMADDMHEYESRRRGEKNAEERKYGYSGL